ncbi:hypothetical protein CRI94_14080 [Longibacter salinarum]|uniref:Uncharacterized protein n=1 Tax=Longibacter salinarum TaxID=1850348 RepID=A0A2A8CV53_9BACT|nr:hypothetical protein [Longibacter salinarum]PEN12639.1 hypothetical protein CRI94_14080 [Longibacter salinarum]
MRRFLQHTLSFALLTLLIAGPAVAQVTDEVSSYTKVRRVKSAELKDIDIKKYPGNDAALMAEFESDPESSESTWALSFYGFTAEPTSMSSAQEIIIVVDGSPVQPLRIESKSRSIDGDIIEIKKAFFSRPIFQRLASAEAMKVTIGAAVFEVPKRAREDMQTILDKIPAKDGRRTASTDGSNRR